MFRLAFLSLITLIAWLIFAWTSGNHLFTSSFVPEALRHLAVGLTAAFAALMAGQLILQIGLKRSLGIEPTGAQRVIIYGLVTFISSAVALKTLGQDITAVLTTSAIITAVVGFALQPTLGGLFSGVALQLDRHIEPGNGIIYDGEDTRIESMNWRSVIGRRRDHTKIVIPNAKLAGETIRVYPEDRSTRHDTFFYAPVSIPPQRVTKLVRELVSDLTFVESTRPVSVAPIQQMPDMAALKYRVRYRIAYYFEIPEVEGEVLRRIWYGFQRHGIPLPVSRLYGQELRDRQTGPLGFPEGYDLHDAVRDALMASEQTDEITDKLEETGQVLLYGPGERIIIPQAWKGRRYLLAAGALNQDDPDFADRRCYGPLPRDGARRLFIYQLADTARIQEIADRLADHIGPYAELAVKKAALSADDLPGLCHRVAAEIGDVAEREEFMAQVLPRRLPSRSPGLVFTADRDFAGHHVSTPHYRAEDEAVIIAIPPELADQFPITEGDTP